MAVAPVLSQTTATTSRLRWLAIPTAILALVFIAHWPALHGSAVWDDAYMLTDNPLITQPGGLSHIIFDPRAMPVYYPLTTGMFWLEARLWGLQNLTGYHAVNMLLHAANAILIWQLLRRLQVPGALLAALLFAVHPVHVESVDWITERKNTLSVFFYLWALLAYLSYRRLPGWANSSSQKCRRGRTMYIASLLLFIAALGAKSAVVTLPGALLLIIWWKTGAITRRDIWQSIPFVLIAAASGSLTQWVEIHYSGAGTGLIDFPLLSRILIAGRSLCFYTAKLLWPSNLCFMYPRWTINPRDPFDWLYVAAPLLVFTTLFFFTWARPRTSSPRNVLCSRAALAALLFFCGTLVPALGFFRVVFQRFTYVADHFQYLASVGILALAAAAITTLFNSLRCRRCLIAVSCLIIAALATLTFHQAGTYISDESVWRDVLQENPTCAAAAVNLGSDLLNRSQIALAEPYIHRAIELDPTGAAGWANLGRIAEARKGYAQALDHYRHAVQLDPSDPLPRFQFANMLMVFHQFPLAAEQYVAALGAKPYWPEAHDNLGLCYLYQGETGAAIEQFQIALRLDPDSVLARKHLDRALHQAAPVRSSQ
jgi:tetratricopeptide (TPR) repeat protein